MVESRALGHAPLRPQCRQHFLYFFPLPQGQGSLLSDAQLGSFSGPPHNKCYPIAIALRELASGLKLAFEPNISHNRLM